MACANGELPEEEIGFEVLEGDNDTYEFPPSDTIVPFLAAERVAMVRDYPLFSILNLT